MLLLKHLVEPDRNALLQCMRLMVPCYVTPISSVDDTSDSEEPVS
jgi:hypothetical protein